MKEKLDIIRKKWLCVAGIIISLCVIFMMIAFVIIPEFKYRNAVNLIENGKYEEAYSKLYNIIDYSKAENEINKFIVVHSREKYTGKDDKISTTDYIYDSRGNCVRKTHTNSEGKAVYNFTYDADNKLLKEERNINNNEYIFIEYSYSANGLLDEEILYSEYTTTKTEYKYDENNNCIKEISTFSALGVDAKEIKEYTYDDKGNKIREKYNDLTIEYSYDKKGNCIKKVEKAKDVKVTEYLFDGNNCVEEIKSYSTGEREYTYYTYDEFDKCIKEESETLVGTEIKEYKYNSLGACVEIVNKNSKGESVTEYTGYQYFYQDNIER